MHEAKTDELKPSYIKRTDTQIQTNMEKMRLVLLQSTIYATDVTLYKGQKYRLESMAALTIPANLLTGAYAFIKQATLAEKDGETEQGVQSDRFY